MSVAGRESYVVEHEKRTDLCLAYPTDGIVIRTLHLEILPGCFDQERPGSGEEFPDNLGFALGCGLFPEIYPVVLHNPVLGCPEFSGVMGSGMQFDKFSAFSGTLKCRWLLSRHVGRRAVTGTEAIDKHADKDKKQNSSPPILLPLRRSAIGACFGFFADLFFAILARGKGGHVFPPFLRLVTGSDPSIFQCY